MNSEIFLWSGLLSQVSAFEVENVHQKPIQQLLQAFSRYSTKEIFGIFMNFLSNSFIRMQVAPVKPPSVPMVVVICCGCCFLQSTIAFVILLPNIYVRRCYISINFALMQFCLSVTATMSFIVLSLLKFLPQVSEPFPVLWFNPNGMSISKYLRTQWISNWKIPRITVKLDNRLPSAKAICSTICCSLLIPRQKFCLFSRRKLVHKKMFIHFLLHFTAWKLEAWIIAEANVKASLSFINELTEKKLYITSVVRIVGCMCIVGVLLCTKLF